MKEGIKQLDLSVLGRYCIRKAHKYIRENYYNNG